MRQRKYRVLTCGRCGLRFAKPLMISRSKKVIDLACPRCNHVSENYVIAANANILLDQVQHETKTWALATLVCMVVYAIAGLVGRIFMR